MPLRWGEFWERSDAPPVRLAWAAVIVVVMAAGLAGGVPAAGAAVVLDITATPSTGLRAGDQVVLSVSNLDAVSLISAGQCDASILESPDPFAAHLNQCTFELLNRPPDGVVTRRVVETFTARDLPGPVHCGDAPGDCVMYVSTDQGSIGFAPIDVVPSALAVAPATVSTRQSFHAWLSGEPGAEHTVAQCATPVPGSLADGDCPVAEPVTLDAAGRAEVELQPVLTISTGAGTADCRSGGCAVASFDAAGALVASVGVTVTQPSFQLDPFPTPSEGLVDGQEITVDVFADTTEPLLVGQCAASITESRDLADGPCRDVREVSVPPGEPGRLGQLTITYTVARTFVGEDGSEVDCSQFTSCVMAVDTVAGDDVSLATRPIEFEHPPPVVTASDTRGLLDGQDITIDVTGLRPGASFILARCDRPADSLNTLIDHCAPPTPQSPTFVEADTAGNMHLMLPADQRYTTLNGTTHVYCRTQCRLVLFASTGSLEVPYTMARGHVSAAPSARLSDAQTVTVTGRRIQPSYFGPTVEVEPTGQWAAYQCAHAVMQDPSPAGVARNCVEAPAAVTVPASGDVTVDIVVHTTIQPPQGPAVDCTPSDRACRVVLHRQEQDGTTTLHQAPISFRRR
jgi:hypothetical protein